MRIIKKITLLCIVGFSFSALSEEKSQKDPACTGKAHKYYSAGFGTEHVYDGKITAQQPVTISLSCDHRTMTISGAITQVIRGEDYKYSSGETMGELADLAAGELVVHVDEDYNFDGFNDLSTIVSNGSGNSAIDTYAVFLYSPEEKKFIFSKDLLEKENLSINVKTKILSEVYNCGFDKNDEPISLFTKYRWKKNHLVRVGKIASCP